MHLLYGAGECRSTPLQKTVISSNKHYERKVNYPILISVCIAGIAAIAETDPASLRLIHAAACAQWLQLLTQLPGA